MKKMTLPLLVVMITLLAGMLSAIVYPPSTDQVASASAIGTQSTAQASSWVRETTSLTRDMEVLYDQPYHDLTAAFSWARSSDENYDYICYDNFDNVTGTIMGVSVTGQSAYFNGISWLDVVEDPMTFHVAFFEDNNGMWGDEITTVECTASREFLFSSGLNSVYKWDLVFPYGVEIQSGWISVRGCSIGSPIDGIFMWRTGDGGDGSSYLNTMLVDLDQGFTLVGTTSAGTFPAAPTNLSLTSDPSGANQCTLQWTNPDQTACLDPLTELTQIKIFQGETLIQTIDNPIIGATDTYTASFSEPSNYSYTLQGINSTGDGLTATVGGWMGEDFPSTCSNVVLSQTNYSELNATVTWENPVTGLHAGVFNNPVIGYHIYRSDGQNFELSGITTTFTDTTIPNSNFYQYSIIPYNVLGNAPSTLSNSLVITNPNTLFTEAFPEMPLPGWTQDGDHWLLNTANHAGGFTPELIHYFYPAYTGVQKMISPVINTENLTSLEMFFRTALYGQQPSGFEVRIETTSNGTDWQEVWTHDPSTMSPQDVFIAIDNSDVGSSNFQVAFVFDGDSSNFVCWYIDNMIISSTGGSSFGTIAGNATLTSGFGNIEEVSILCAGNVVHPDANGDFSVNVTAGTYSITASLEGYEPTTLNDIVVTSNNTTQVTIDLSPSVIPLNPPQTVAVCDTTGMLSWDPPLGYSTWIGYDDGENYNAVGTNSPMLLSVASRWESDELEPYDGMQMTSIKFFPTVLGLDYNLTIWNGTNAATIVYEQMEDNIIENQWNEITLTTPYTIDASQEMWFGYRVNTNATNPAGTDDGPAIVGYGDLIRLDEQDWGSMATLYSIDHNWNLKALVGNSDLSRNTRDFLGYNIYLDDASVATNISEEHYLFSNLVETQEYTAGVSAVYAEGESTIETVTFTFHQGTFAAPSNLVFSNETSIFGWDAVSESGHSNHSPLTLLASENTRDFTGYDVYLDGNQIATNVPETSITLENLVDNQEYTAGVRARYDEGASTIIELTFTYEEPVLILPPVNVTVNDVTGLVSWLAPGTTPDNWIGYDNGVAENAIGTEAPNTFNVAARWDVDGIAAYDGMVITKIRFVAFDAATQYKVRVWSGANAANLLIDQLVTNPLIEDWSEVLLETPVTIDANEELWIGYNCVTQGGNPAGVDGGPATEGYSDLIQFVGGEWNSLVGNYNLNYNWCLKAFVQNANGTEATLSPIVQNNSFATPCYTPENLCVAPAASHTRDFTGYTILLNGTELATNVTDMEYQLENLVHGQPYIVGVKAVYDEGTSPAATASFTYNGVDAHNMIPSITQLLGNYPNPFNPTTEIRFSLSSPQKVSLTVYNAKGELVKTLVNDYLETNTHSILWNGTDNTGASLSSGVYFYRLHTKEMHQTKKMILLK